MKLTREQVRQWRREAASLVAIRDIEDGPRLHQKRSVNALVALCEDWLEMDKRMRLAEARVKEFVDTR